jgi:hypothetical protein
MWIDFEAEAAKPKEVQEFISYFKQQSESSILCRREFPGALAFAHFGKHPRREVAKIGDRRRRPGARSLLAQSNSFCALSRLPKKSAELACAEFGRSCSWAFAVGLRALGLGARVIDVLDRQVEFVFVPLRIAAELVATAMRVCRTSPN